MGASEVLPIGLPTASLEGRGGLPPLDLDGGTAPAGLAQPDSQEETAPKVSGRDVYRLLRSDRERGAGTGREGAADPGREGGAAAKPGVAFALLSTGLPKPA